MEEDEDNSSHILNKPKEMNESILETSELMNTEQFNFVTDSVSISNDSQLVAAESQIVAEHEEAVVVIGSQNDSQLVRAESPIVAELEEVAVEEVDVSPNEKVDVSSIVEEHVVVVVSENADVSPIVEAYEEEVVVAEDADVSPIVEGLEEAVEEADVSPNEKAGVSPIVARQEEMVVAEDADVSPIVEGLGEAVEETDVPPIVAKHEEVVVAEDDDVSPIVVKHEEEVVEEEEAGDVSKIVGKDWEADVAVDVRVVNNEMGTETEETLGFRDDLRLVSAESLVVTKELNMEAEKGSGGECSQLITAESPIFVKESEDTVIETKIDVTTAVAESSIIGKDGDSVLPKEDIPMVDSKVELETERRAPMEVNELDKWEVVGTSIEDDEGDEMVVVAEEEEVATEGTELEDENAAVDTDMEAETEVLGSGKLMVGKRKRGRNSKNPGKASTGAPPQRKTIGEDVCFICFDGGDLVLCDRRGCPKGYHPSCVNRDEAFFQAKGRWYCGWHLCSICEKNAHYMCYTCTFSLCKECIKDAVILCVRGNKGFCETCMKTCMLIESNEQGKAQVDFDDKSSWEYLFKDYWIDLKAKLSLSSVELAQARNPWKGYNSDVLVRKEELLEEHFDADKDGGSGSDNSSENLEASKSKRKKSKKRLKSVPKEDDSTSVDKYGGSGSDNASENLEARKSKRRKSKKRSNSVPKEDDSTSDVGAVRAEGISTSGSAEWASKGLLEFVMHMKDGDGSILSQFDVQALLLEYITRNNLRDPRRKSQIKCDSRLENLFGKVRVGHFEMLKLLESHFLIKEESQADDIQGSVVDTEFVNLEADQNTDALVKGGKYGKRKTRKKGFGGGPQSNLDDYAAIDMHNITLIYLRRKLMEDLLEDIEKFHEKVVGTFVRIRISGSMQKQDLYRLVQVVGTSKAAEPYKVGKKITDIMLEILNLNKTEVVSIDTISNQEFSEDECKRLRQSIKCGLINRLTVGDILDKTMEVQAARVNDWLETEIVRLSHLRDRASDLGRRKELRECVEKLQLLKTPEERLRRLEEIPKIHADPKMDPSYESEEDDNEMDDNRSEVYMRPRGSGFSRRGREPLSPGGGDFSSKDSWSATRKSSSNNWEYNRSLSGKNFSNKGEDATLSGEIMSESSIDHVRDKDTQQQSKYMEKPNSSTTFDETVGWNSHYVVRSESFSGVVPETSQPAVSVGIVETAAKVNETDKIWHYKDPSGKIQGPFSIVQLRKWSSTGYFPVDLKIWRTTEKQDDFILLNDALAGRFQRESPAGVSTRLPTANTQPNLSSSRGLMTPPIEVPKLSLDRWDRNDSSGLPSPTPNQSTTGWTGGEVGNHGGPSSFSCGNGALQSPAAAASDSGQAARSSAPTSLLDSSGQLARDSENVSHSSPTNFNPALNTTEQGVLAVGTNSSLPAVSSKESHGVQTHSYLLPASDTAAHAIQSANGQNPRVETHGWGSPSQKVEPNSSIPMNGQPQAYGHWVSNPGGNFATQGGSSVSQSDSWRPPISGNQFNIQTSAPCNVPWGAGIPGNNNTPAPGSVHDNVNTGWGTVQGNPNMGWGGPAPGGMNMNWGATMQGPSPGNVNPGWVVPTGNPGATVQVPVSGSVNPGWVVPTGNPGAIVQGLVHGNANQGWVAPQLNTGATVQGPVPGTGNSGWGAPVGNPVATVQGPIPGNANSGWGAPSGNPGATTVQGPAPGNANSSWGAPAGNQGATFQGPAPGNANPGWGAPAGNCNGDRFSGSRDGDGRGGHFRSGGNRPWNRQSSFGSGRSGGSFRHSNKKSIVCPYFANGRCRKGDACDYLHT